MTRWVALVASVAAVATVAGLAGCGGGGTPAQYSVAGLVTRDGEPLAGVSVSVAAWSSASALATSGSATTGADGRYTVSGLDAGPYRVTPQALEAVVWTPPSRTVVLSGDRTDLDFAARTIDVEHGAVRGTIVLPDGTTPVAGAWVYVPPVGAPADSPPEDAVASTRTAVDGTFSLLDAPVGEQEIRLAKGAWRKTVAVTVPAAASVDVPTSDTGLVATTEGGLPQIAVVTGRFDRLQDVLAKLGVGELDASGRVTTETAPFDLYDGDGALGEAFPEASDLFADPTLLATYRLIVLNCGAGETPLDDPATAANLRAFVAAGGRLLATDWAYDFLEQSVPEAVDYLGDGADPGVAETRGAAEVGESVTFVSATPLDETCAAWLAARSALTSGNLRVSGFLPSWAVIDSAGAGATAWLEAPVSWAGGAGTRPLAVTAPHGDGLVTVASFRTVSTASTSLRQQEWALAWLLLESL